MGASAQECSAFMPIFPFLKTMNVKDLSNHLRGEETVMGLNYLKRAPTDLGSVTSLFSDTTTSLYAPTPEWNMLFYREGPTRQAQGAGRPRAPVPSAWAEPHPHLRGRQDGPKDKGKEAPDSHELRGQARADTQLSPIHHLLPPASRHQRPRLSPAPPIGGGRARKGGISSLRLELCTCVCTCAHTCVHRNENQSCVFMTALLLQSGDTEAGCQPRYLSKHLPCRRDLA